MKLISCVLAIATVLSITSAQAALNCQAFADTDLSEKKLSLTQTMTSETSSFEYSDEAQMLYISADQRAGEDWILLSIQTGNTGTAVDAAFRPLQGQMTAELLFTQYTPKTNWTIRCVK